MGISLDSLSITSAFNSILSFFKSQENNSKWKDYTSGAEGTFLIRMLANILSNISYRLVTARRENYLSTANLKSSALGIALNLGYSANRGTNQKRTIRFEPNGDYVIPPFTALGPYNDEYDVIYLGELDSETGLREGMILNGPLNIALVRGMSSLTRTITLATDVTKELKSGDLLDISGTGTEADGRYTVSTMEVKTVGANNLTYVSVVENIPADFTNTGSQNAWATKVTLHTFKTVIGKLKTITWVANTAKVQPFTRFETGISEDYMLFVDGEEVPVSNVTRELKNDKYLVRTNPYASVDVLYLNNLVRAQHKYGSESVFMLKYVELADPETIDYAPTLSGFGTVLDTLTIDQFIDFESLEQIKVNAPVDHDVQHLIRSKRDYAKRIKQSFPNIVEAAYTAVTPTYTLVSYLKDDCTILQESEITKIKTILDGENYFGTPTPDISHPHREATNINIQLFVTDKLKDTNDIRYDVNNILKSNYAKYLEQTFDVYTLERLLEQLSYVKWARVSFDIGEWNSRGLVDLGNLINVDGTIYKAEKILGTTGGFEPAWNVPLDVIPRGIDLDGNYETTDGTVVWRAYKRLDVESIQQYQTSHKYCIGDYVYTPTLPNFMFKCVDLLKSTGTSNLDTTTVMEGDFLIDGEIVWVCKTYSSSYPTRFVATQYRLGTSCNINGKSFEVIGYTGRTGYLIPAFEQAYYPVVGVVLPQIVLDFTLTENGYFQIAGNQVQMFEVGSTIVASTDKGKTNTFQVLNRTYNEKTDRTNVYINGFIDTPYVPIASAVSGAYSIFTLNGDYTDIFKVGDNIRALGTMVDSETLERLSVSYNYIIADVKSVLSEGATVTQVWVKSTLASNVNYTTLVAAGYTSIKSELKNSFILEGDVSSFFKAGALDKAKTDEDIEITYSIKDTSYQNVWDITYVFATQEISSTANYNRLAPTWQGTEDGEVKWGIVNSTDAITYDWDVYNDIEYKLTVSR